MRSPATSTWDSIPDSEICARGVAHPSPEVNSGEQYSFSILGVPQISRFSRCGPRTEATDFPRSSETTHSDPCDRDEPHISQNTRERNTQEKNWRNHLNAECHYTASIGGRPAQPDRNPNYYVINTHITVRSRAAPNLVQRSRGRPPTPIAGGRRPGERCTRVCVHGAFSHKGCLRHHH